MVVKLVKSSIAHTNAEISHVRKNAWVKDAKCWSPGVSKHSIRLLYFVSPILQGTHLVNKQNSTPTVADVLMELKSEVVLPSR